ncbi:hypothetical protein [Paraburkholderia ultramafica]|nr:hypothetical protein [Paraburkholderia ultramafica]
MLAIALVGTTATASAFAQTDQPSHPAAPAQVAQTGASSSPGMASYSQPLAQKTRADVYQQLVNAMQDGEIAYLNSTVYKGSE